MTWPNNGMEANRRSKRGGNSDPPVMLHLAFPAAVA